MERKETTRIRGKPIVNLGCKPCHGANTKSSHPDGVRVDTGLQRGSSSSLAGSLRNSGDSIERNWISDLHSGVGVDMNKWLIKFLCSLAPTQLPLLHDPIINVLAKHGYDPDTCEAVAGHILSLLAEVIREECENANA